MTTEQKSQLVDQLSTLLSTTPHLYIADTTGLNAVETTKLRRLCFRRNIQLVVVKNTLLKRALATTGIDYTELYPALKGTSAILLSTINNDPAKVIKEFGTTCDKFKLKGAYVEESFYIGAQYLESLIAIKSKNELLGELIGQLQSPLQNVLGALQSGSRTITGVLKTLETKAA